MILKIVLEKKGDGIIKNIKIVTVIVVVVVEVEVHVKVVIPMNMIQGNLIRRSAKRVLIILFFRLFFFKP